MRISDWSSDVCSSDLLPRHVRQVEVALGAQVVHDGSQRAHGAVRTARAGGDALPVAGVLHARLGADGPALAVLVAVAHALRRQVDQRPVEVVAEGGPQVARIGGLRRSEEHTSELQSLMRLYYAVFCLQKKTRKIYDTT